jgi:oligoendopeptidase F
MIQDVYTQMQTAQCALTETQMETYAKLLKDATCLKDYRASYEGPLRHKMDTMFEGNCAIFATSENALKGAFVQYLPEEEHPVAYFGPGYQDNLTLVHENGHFASMFYFDNSSLPFELAETHSQGNEWMYVSYLNTLDTIDDVVMDAFTLSRAFSGMVTILYSTMVDEFEEIVYTSETPVKAEEFAGIMQTVTAKYEGCAELFTKFGLRDPFEYIQYVTVSSPCYYLSYATSEIASMSLYAIANEKGYKEAQAVYTTLQEGIDPTLDFLPAIESAGLLSPLVESTYHSLEKIFVAPKTQE